MTVSSTDGTTGWVVLTPVEISGLWSQLGETADAMAFEAAAAAADMETAATSWAGLISSYEEPGTQDVVHSAFDAVPGVTGAWADVLARAADVLQGFATEAGSLESRASDLHAEAARLQAWLWVSGLISGLAGDLTAEDELLQRQIVRHNDDVLALNSRWEQLVQETAETLDSIAGGGGLEEDVPEVTAEGGVYSVTAAGSSGSGGGSGDGAFSAALIRMVRSGAEPDEDPVEEAQDRFETLTGEDVTGQDVKEFYSHLAGMSAEEIEEFSEQTPAVHENSIPQPSNEAEYDDWPDGEAGNNWWTKLEDAGVQEAVKDHLPLVVGNVQGVPYKHRDEANQNALQRLKENEDYDQWDKNLEQVDRAVNQEASNGERMLLSLDIGQRDRSLEYHGTPKVPHEPGGVNEVGWEQQPLAAISVGDPDTANTTSFGVPGMASGTHKMVKDVTNSDRLYRELQEQGDDEHAVVSWVGYDAPPKFGDEDALDVLGDDRASTGGWKLAYALDGFHDTRIQEGEDAEDFNVNVHAHSYGTNTAAHALTRVSHTVDAYSMYGSAGIPEGVADEASDLKVAKDSDGDPMVFASESSQDGTAGLGRMPLDRQDPTDEDFGAQVHYSGGDHDSSTDTEEGVTGHSRVFDGEDERGEYGYLDRDTQHFENLIHILSGENLDDIVTQEEYEDGVPPKAWYEPPLKTFW